MGAVFGGESLDSSRWIWYDYRCRMEENEAIPDKGQASIPKDLSKQEKIKLREARKANRSNRKGE